MKRVAHAFARLIGGFVAMIIISALIERYLGNAWDAGFWSGAFVVWLTPWMLRPLDELWPTQSSKAAE
jgi:hypothetical protein